jgi:hypothetical protein
LFFNTTSLNEMPNQGYVRIVPKEIYRPCVETAVPILKIRAYSVDSTFSPSLSEIEIADIIIAEREFAQGESEIFDDAESLIDSLHALRRRHEENRE